LAAQRRCRCERWSDEACRLTCLPPVSGLLARMLAWSVEATDFRPSRSGGGSERAAAHSLRECRRTMVRRRGQVAGPWVSGHTRCLHTCWGGAGRRGRILRPPRSGGGSVPVAAHSLRECRGAMARRGGPLAYLGYPVTPMLAHMLARGGGRGRFFDHRETAAGVCPWPRTVCESVGRRRRDGAGSDLSRWCGFPLVWRMSISRLANSWREGLPEMCRP
jgi:hypothetical protein